MKNFKKAIAVLLAVLMVAFSVPFTAMAATISDNDYSQVVAKVHVTPYISDTEYGYASATTARDLDVTNISYSDLGDDHKVAVYITTENLLAVDTMNLVWYFDPDVLSPVTMLAGPVQTGYVTAANDISTFEDSCNVSFSQGEFDCSAQTSTSYEGGTIDGIVWGIFVFEVLQDNANVAWTYADTADMYGWDTQGMINFDDAYFWGDDSSDFECTYAEATAVGPVTKEITYTFADGTSTTIEEGDAAPANTADTAWADNGNGTHSKTTYAWTADGENFVEVGSTQTANCDSATVKTAAVAPVHNATTLTNGKTAVTVCSVCGGNEQGGETIVAQHTYTTAVTAPTCVAQGYTTYTCSCGASYVDNYTAIDATAHTGQLVTDEAVAATCNATGLTEGSHWDCCGAVEVAQEVVPVDATAHNYEVTASTGATCKTAGSVTYTCSICGDSYTDTGALDPTNHEGTLVTDEAVAATCVAGGKTAGSHYDCCGAVVVAQEDTPVDTTNHVGGTHTENAAAATCTAAGYTGDEVCDSCGNVVTAGAEIAIDPTAHTGQIVTDEAVPATASTAGLTEGSHWDCCGAVVVAQEEVAPLGVTITVAGDSSNVTVNDVAYAGPANVAFGSTYTISSDAENFAAWMVGDKIVSTSATYSTVAFADTTYTAVYEDATATTFNVNFVDKFNNVLASYTNEEVAAWTDMPALTSPFNGYEIAGYDMNLDEIKAATAETFVNVEYTAIAQTFTVNAQGATITVDGVDYTDTATVTGYDVPVTVYADGATAWTVNGKEAGFGNTYSFFVTSDVTISFEVAVIEAKPVVTAVNGNGDLQTGVKVRFVASRNVPDTYKVLESGFIYGKGLSEDQMMLNNIGNGVYKYTNSNTSLEGQFAFTFGVKNGTSPATARAYLVVLNYATGATETYYADAQIYNY